MTNPQDPYRLMAEQIFEIVKLKAEHRKIPLHVDILSFIEEAIRNNTVVPEMLETLKPFAKLLHSHHRPMKDSDPIFQIEDVLITAGDLRKANKLLAKAKGIT